MGDPNPLGPPWPPRGPAGGIFSLSPTLAHRLSMISRKKWGVKILPEKKSVWLCHTLLISLLNGIIIHVSKLLLCLCSVYENFGYTKTYINKKFILKCTENLPNLNSPLLATLFLMKNMSECVVHSYTTIASSLEMKI